MTWVFMLVIFGGIIFHMRIARGLNEKTIAFIRHLGATYCLRVQEQVSRPGGVISIMLFRRL